MSAPTTIGTRARTYYLESKLGWSGLAIEPQREFATDYARHRPRTTFLPFFVSDVSNATAKLHLVHASSTVASANEAFVRQFTPTGKVDEVREVPTITLTDLLDAQRITRIDFLNIDIELHEPKALEGFDIAGSDRRWCASKAFSRCVSRFSTTSRSRDT